MRLHQTQHMPGVNSSESCHPILSVVFERNWSFFSFGCQRRLGKELRILCHEQQQLHSHIPESFSGMFTGNGRLWLHPLKGISGYKQQHVNTTLSRCCHTNDSLSNLTITPSTNKMSGRLKMRDFCGRLGLGGNDTSPRWQKPEGGIFFLDFRSVHSFTHSFPCSLLSRVGLEWRTEDSGMMGCGEKQRDRERAKERNKYFSVTFQGPNIPSLWVRQCVRDCALTGSRSRSCSIQWQHSV